MDISIISIVSIITVCIIVFLAAIIKAVHDDLVQQKELLSLSLKCNDVTSKINHCKVVADYLYCVTRY